MRIWDCIMFDNELDMLELRLRTMSEAVYRHVIVEGETTHRGVPKPLAFWENRDRFARWAGKIEYVPCGPLQGAEPWAREHWQRDQAAQGMSDLRDDDFVLVADCDEIIPPAELQGAVPADSSEVVGFRPRIMMYAVDWEYPGRFEGLPEPRLAAGQTLRRMGGLAAVRGFQGRMPEVAAGFHLTWLGPVAQVAKLDRNCHTEATQEMRDRVASGRAYQTGLHISGIQLAPVEVDGTYPEWIRTRQCPPEWFRPRGEA